VEFNFNDFAKAFLSILFTGMPFLLFGTLFAGIVEAFVPSKVIKSSLPKNPVLAVIVSGFLGMILPMCECGVVAVLRRLINKGLPVSCAVTYMLASPIVNPIVILSTYTAFTNQSQFPMTGARVGMGYFIAVIVGLSLLRQPAQKVLNQSVLFIPRSGLFKGGFARTETNLEMMSFSSKLRHALHCASVDFIDVAAFLVMGAGIAAIFNTAIPQTSLAVFANDPFLSINLMIGMAIILCLCSSTDAFVAASITGFPNSAKLAMVVFGPMFDLKLLFLYLSVFRPFFIFRAVGIIYIVTLIGCYLLNFTSWFQ